MEISDELFFNIVKDWEKKEISSEQKSVLLKVYLKEHKLSQRSLAKSLNIPHSTLHDWISGRQMIKYYNKKAENLSMDNSTIYSLADRLMFLLVKANTLTDREINKLKILVNEIEKKDILVLED